MLYWTIFYNGMQLYMEVIATLRSLVRLWREETWNRNVVQELNEIWQILGLYRRNIVDFKEKKETNFPVHFDMYVNIPGAEYGIWCNRWNLGMDK